MMDSSSLELENTSTPSDGIGSDSTKAYSEAGYSARVQFHAATGKSQTDQPLDEDRERCWKILTCFSFGETYRDDAYRYDSSMPENPLDTPGTPALSSEFVSGEGARPFRLGETDRVPGEMEPHRFEPIEYLGAGGFGVVIRARDLRLHRDVALKMLRPSLGNSPRLIRRFLREARAVASLQHTGIVQIFETGVLGGIPYIVAELVEGPSLSSWLKANESVLAPRTSAWIVKQVASAVHFAHTRGILHRDLKPSNILLAAAPNGETEDFGYQPRLTDFGLAKRFEGNERDPEDLTLEMQTLGTPRYMSPEQASGQLRDVAIASDVFTLGIVLYRLLTGKLPFDGQRNSEVIEEICRASPMPPRRLNSKIPQDLEAVVLKCLARRPEDRYRSAEELAEDLDCFLKGIPVKAAKATLLKRSWCWARTNPWWAAALAVLMIAVFFAVAATTLAIRRDHLANRQARDSLFAMHKLLFPLAEKLNDSQPISLEYHREILQGWIEITEDFCEKYPRDYRALHHLSVLHHYSANVNHRLAQIDATVENRTRSLAILERLLVENPIDRRRYLFDIFTSRLWLGVAFRDHNQGVVDNRSREEFLKAKDAIEALLVEEKDNPDYLDAYNALRLDLAACTQSEEERDQLTQAVIECSLGLFERYPEKPLWAKHAVVGEMRRAHAADAKKDWDRTYQHAMAAYRIHVQAYGTGYQEDQHVIDRIEINLRLMRSLVAQRKPEEAVAHLEQERDVILRLTEKVKNPAWVPSRMMMFSLLAKRIYEDLNKSEQALQMHQEILAYQEQIQGGVTGEYTVLEGL